MNVFLRAIFLVGLFFFSLLGHSQSVVISEIYGAGGNASAVFRNDFIELYNPTNSDVSLVGLSVQYASAAGTTWAVTNLSGSIAAKGYYLIQQASGGAAGVVLPTADLTGTINMSATNGKVALVNGTVALTGANPTGAIDLVGFGTANGFEGTGSAPTPTPLNTSSIERKANASSTSASMAVGGADEFLGNGFDSNNNANDFVIRANPQPQNSASPLEPVIVDSTPPTFNSGFPTAANILQTQFDLVVQLNEIGAGFYVVVANGAPAPSAAQVRAGQNDQGIVVALASGFSIPSINSSVSKTVTGLTAATTYDVYVVAQDGVPNLQALPTKITVTTSASVVPVITPSISSVTIAGLTDKGKLSPAQTYTVSASDLTADLAISVSGNFLLSTDNSAYSQSISIDKSLAASTQTIFVKFNPSGNVGMQSGTISHASAGATTKTISLSGTSYDPFNQNFNDPTFFSNSGWTQFSKVGAQLWASTNFGRTCLTGCNAATPDKAAQINGFFSGAPRDNEDWLISPLLDITGFVSFPMLSFWTVSAFAGDALQLKYSTNYTGSGDPTLATWTTIDGKFPPSNSSLWTQSSNIILPKQAIYVALVYTSNTSSASRWTFDDWQITDVASYIDVPTILYSFGEISSGNSSASNSFSFTSIGYGDITVTPSAGYQVSLDNVNFSTSQTVSATDAAVGKTIYVRFSPTSKQLKWDGAINFKGTGLDTNYGKLSGSSFLKAETMDIVTYNLEFFGTDVKNTSNVEFGPLDDALQISNVTTVIQTIGADIYGVQEVADDNALNTLVSNLPGYDKIVSNRWSYSFDPPDPNFPPQKIGFIYNTATVQVIDSRVMFAKLFDDVRAGNTNLLPGYPTSGGNTPANFWSSGRLPFMVTFDVTVSGIKKRIKAVVIHAKSGSAQADYERRKYDVKVLRDSLVANYANDNIILLGDFNDDVDVSIGAPTNPESTYKIFVDDVVNFNALTYTISQAGAFSFPNSSSFLDHIIISDELTNVYIPNSIAVEDSRTYINNYVNTTSDHLPVSARLLLSVKTDQTITFNTLPARTFGDAAFALSASSSSGLPVNYLSSDPTIASISGNIITILKAGTVTITASQPGDGSYNAATNVAQQLVINKANQTISFNALPNRTFGDVPFPVSASATSNLSVAFSSSDITLASVSGNTITILKTGTVNITASQAGDGNYNAATNVVQQLVINKANQTISFNALPNKTFGDVPFSIIASSTSNLAVDFSSSDATVASVSGTTITILKTGTVNITASQAGDGNYNAATNVVQQLVINKANQTISLNALPNKTFGDVPFTITASSTSNLAVAFSSSDATVASVNGNTITILKAGTVNITASQAGDGNYSAASNVVQILVINKANQSITFPPIADKQFGDIPFTLTANATSTLPVVFTSQTTDKISVAGNQASIVAAGRATIVASQPGNTNFNAATNASQSFCIKPARPTVSVSFASGIANLTSSVSGGYKWFLNGVLIPNATGQTYAATLGGTYKVQVTIDDCVSDFSLDNPVVITGDTNGSTKSIDLYPNPANKSLFISGLEPETNQCTLVDALGRNAVMPLEKVNEQHSLNTENLVDGVYLIRVKQSDSVKQLRFIKKD